MSEFLVDLAVLSRTPRGADAVGGKARQLAKLGATGVAIPKGFVLLAGSRPVWSRGIQHIERALEQLGDVVVVRSSATIEDSENGGAPGIYASVRDVPRRVEDVLRAAGQVCDSVESEAAKLYQKARGAQHVRMAVLVQTQIDGTLGALYSRMPGDADASAVAIEFTADDALEFLRVPRTGPVADTDSRILESGAIESIRAAGLAAEAALSLSGGADVEWVWDGAETWVVQARAIHHRAHTRRADHDPKALAFSRDDPDRVWSLDATHNPAPLSRAQQDLVARADNLGVTPYSMRCVDGYLYTADAVTPVSQEQPRMRVPLDVARLRAAIDALTARAEHALAPLETDPPPTVQAALHAYDDLYRVYAGALSPLLARARRALTREAEASGVLDLHSLLRAPSALLVAFDRCSKDPSTFDELLALARAVAQAWDVAAPTYGEHPALLRDAVRRFAASRSGGRAHLGGRAQDGSDAGRGQEPHASARLVALGTLIGTATEDDDLLFWRAQAGVRRALQAAAQRARVEPADVFHLPIDQVSSWGPDDPPDLAQVSAEARTNRATLARQRRTSMPLRFRDGTAMPQVGSGSAGSWRGAGTGGTAHGRVWRAQADDGLDSAPPGAVVVARTASPAMSLVARSAVALVCEYGGLLGHGAALARELGIPCVVGCTNAWQQLETGDVVWVDADGGRVLRLP